MKPPPSSAPPPQAAFERLAALERQWHELSNRVAVRFQVPLVPEYDPTHWPAPQAQTAPSRQNVATPRRNWGFEQVMGPPDTPRAGDLPSAWAPREPDGGPEWLWVDFEQAVDIAEVRIRETYNPGAISKVTGIVNGQEMVLWEGTATGGEAPRDLLVPVTAAVRARSIIVHLDTTRAAGWNEIDAVELIGRDGTRQWAAAANASSTYAEPNPPPAAAPTP